MAADLHFRCFLRCLLLVGLTPTEYPHFPRWVANYSPQCAAPRPQSTEAGRKYADRIMGCSMNTVLRVDVVGGCQCWNPVSVPMTRDNAVTARNADEAEPTGYPTPGRRSLFDQRRPFLAICLSYQVLSTLLGFGLIRLHSPNQGMQKEIDLFGTYERVGFYNTFAAWSGEDKVECRSVGLVEVSRDPQTGEVHALRGPGFAPMQFHAESVLTQNGIRIVGEFMEGVTDTCQPVVPVDSVSL
jgi:Glutamine amidotransferase class-I